MFVTSVSFIAVGPLCIFALVDTIGLPYCSHSAVMVGLLLTLIAMVLCLPVISVGTCFAAGNSHVVWPGQLWNIFLYCESGIF